MFYDITTINDESKYPSHGFIIMNITTINDESKYPSHGIVIMNSITIHDLILVVLMLILQPLERP